MDANLFPWHSGILKRLSVHKQVMVQGFSSIMQITNPMFKAPERNCQGTHWQPNFNCGNRDFTAILWKRWKHSSTPTLVNSSKKFFHRLAVSHRGPVWSGPCLDRDGSSGGNLIRKNLTGDGTHLAGNLFGREPIWPGTHLIGDPFDRQLGGRQTIWFQTFNCIDPKLHI